MTVDINNGQQTIATTRTRISLKEVLVQSAAHVPKGKFLDIVFGDSQNNVTNAKFLFEKTDGIDMETKHLDPSRNYVSCQGISCSYCEQHRLNSKVYTPHTRYYFPVMFQNAYYTWEIDQKFFSTFANLVKFGEAQEWQIKRTRTEHGKPRYTMKLITEMTTPSNPLESIVNTAPPKAPEPIETSPEPIETSPEPTQTAEKLKPNQTGISLNIPEWNEPEINQSERNRKIVNHLWNSAPLNQHIPQEIRSYLSQIVNKFSSLDWSNPKILNTVSYHITLEKPGHLHDDISERLISRLKEIGAI